MANWINRRIYPRGVGRFGVFEIAVFNEELWPGLEHRAERTKERQRPSVYRLLDQPQDAWIFSSVFDPATVRAAVDGLAQSFRAPRRSDWIALDQPVPIQFGATFTHELWPALDFQGGSFRSLAPPIRLRLEQPVSGFHFGATYSHELWPGVEQRSIRLPERQTWRTVEQPDLAWIFTALAFDPVVARAALDLLLGSFRVDSRPSWRVIEQPSFTQTFPFDPQFIVASIHALLASYRAANRPIWLPTDEPLPAWIFENLPVGFDATLFPAIAQLFQSSWRDVRTSHVWDTRRFPGRALPSGVEPEQLAFIPAFFPGIGQLLQSSVYDVRISHIWDTRRFPGRALPGGVESPALDFALVSGPLAQLAASFLLQSRPSRLFPESKFSFALVDARLIRPALDFLASSFRVGSRPTWRVWDVPSFTQDFPFDPQFITASVAALWAAFRADPRKIWLPTDEPLPAWIFENIPPPPPFDPAAFPWVAMGEWLRGRPGIPMESQFLAEPGFPRPLFKAKPIRRRKKC